MIDSSLNIKYLGETIVVALSFSSAKIVILVSFGVVDSLTVSVHPMYAIGQCTATTTSQHHKNEAVEPHTKAIITRFLSRVFYRHMRQNSSIHINYIEWRFGRCGWCECEARVQALHQQHYFKQL